MEITFYKIANPTAGNIGFATISQITRLHKLFREVYINSLRSRIHLDILKENDNKYIFYSKIPSDRVETVFYNVIIEMEKTDSELNFTHAKLKIWSNDPNFMFSYTWVLAKENLIPDFLLPKCSRKALTDPPDIRNPLQIWHMHKYANYLRYHILYKGYLNPIYLEKNKNTNLTKEIIFRSVSSQEDKLLEVKRKEPK